MSDIDNKAAKACQIQLKRSYDAMYAESVGIGNTCFDVDAKYKCVSVNLTFWRRVFSFVVPAFCTHTAPPLRGLLGD